MWQERVFKGHRNRPPEPHLQAVWDAVVHLCGLKDSRVPHKEGRGPRGTSPSDLFLESAKGDHLRGKALTDSYRTSAISGGAVGSSTQSSC